jgi:hypothetical protein
MIECKQPKLNDNFDIEWLSNMKGKERIFKVHEAKNSLWDRDNHDSTIIERKKLNDECE